MTPSERTLLLALFRWARAKGGLAYGTHYTWTRLGPREQRWGVSFYPGDWEPGEPVALEIWRGRDTMKTYWVTDVAEAVDLVAALGIVPARFSTAYRAGYDACMRAHRIARQRVPGQAYPRGWSDPEVYALLPAADHELAVRR